MSRARFMQSTTVAASKTVAEIQAMLGASGMVRMCHVEYSDDGEVDAVGFVVVVQNQDVPFRLRARDEEMYQYLQSQRSHRTRHKEAAQERDREKASAIAWRQMYRWIQAQLAMIESGMRDVTEVFMADIVVGRDGVTTLGERFLENPQKLLTGGK